MCKVGIKGVIIKSEGFMPLSIIRVGFAKNSGFFMVGFLSGFPKNSVNSKNKSSSVKI